MGPQASNWQERTANSNARMLSTLEQLQANMKDVPAEQRMGAAAAMVRNLIGGGEDMDAALAGMAPGDYQSLLDGTCKALERDLRAYYYREITRMFGGRPTVKKLPNGETIRTETPGTVNKGPNKNLSWMTDEPRAAIQAIKDNTAWDALRGKTWRELRDEIVNPTKQALAEDEANKQFISNGHKVRRADMSEAIAKEMEQAWKPLPESVDATPEHGTLAQRDMWRRSSPGTQGMVLTGGDLGSITHAVLSTNWLAANDAQMDQENGDLREYDAKRAELGYTTEDRIIEKYVLKSVPLSGGRVARLSQGRLMTLYGYMLDPHARVLILNNGFLSSLYRGMEDETHIIKGMGNTLEERLADQQDTVTRLLGELRDRDRKLVEWEVVQKSRDWAQRMNKTSVEATGISIAGEDPHQTLKGAISREPVIPNVDDPAAPRLHMVDQDGIAKERRPHSNPVYLRDSDTLFRQQARDMSTYNAWSKTYRDTVTVLSKGAAKHAIVSRWGTRVIGNMKDALGYLTYQKGHTDNFNELQRGLQAVERNVSAYTIGANPGTFGKVRFMMSLHPYAERQNAADMMEVLAKHGWTREQMVPFLESAFRRSQTPSTQMEKSYQFTAIRRSGFGVLAPFLGEPTVLSDQWQAEGLRAKKTGDRRRFYTWKMLSMMGMAASTLVGLMIYRAQRNMLGAGQPSDKKEERAAYQLISDIATQLAELKNPLWGGLGVKALLPVAAWGTTGYKDALREPVSEQGLLDGLFSEYSSIRDLGVRQVDKGNLTSAQWEQLGLASFRLYGQLAGLPVGGLEKGGRAIVGAVGAPIGVAEDKPTGIGLMPAEKKGGGYGPRVGIMPVPRGRK